MEWPQAEEDLALHKATQAALPVAVKPDPSKVEAEAKAKEEVETLRRRIACEFPACLAPCP